MRKYQPWVYAAASFVLTVLVMAVIFTAKQIVPFGGQNVMYVADSMTQYYPFAKLFREMLQTGASPFYSWHLGLGDNAWVWLAYYLFNPTCLLYGLVSEGALMGLMNIMYIIKLGLLAASVCWYLNRAMGARSEMSVILALCVSLSEWTVLNGANIMWLDVWILTPLILYQLERMLRGHPGWKYGVLLAVAVLTNYYAGFILCVSLCAWAVWSVFRTPIRFSWRPFVRFIAWSIPAGLVSAVAWVPTLAGASGYLHAPSSVSWTHFASPIELIAHHMPMTAVTLIVEETPVLFCGLLTVCIAPLYFRRLSIFRSEKIATAALLGLLWLSFLWEPLEYVWHGFHQPAGLPGRQSFIYLLLLARMAYKVLTYRQEIQLKWLKDSVIVLLVMWAAVLVTSGVAGILQILVSAVIAALLGLWFVLDREYHTKPVMAVGLLAICLLDLGVTDFFMTCWSADKDAFKTAQIEELQALEDQMDERSGQDFYRADIQADQYNVCLSTGMSSASMFSSVMSRSQGVWNGMFNQGYKINLTNFDAMSPLANSLAGVRYIIQEKDTKIGLWQTKQIGTTDSFTLEENQEVIPFGCMVPAESDNWQEGDIGTLWFQLQNEWARTIVPGVQDVLVRELAGESAEQTTTVTVPKSGYYTGHLAPDESSNQISISGTDAVYYNGRKLQNVYFRRPGYPISLGWLEEGDEIKIDLSGHQFRFDLYRWDTDACEQVLDRLQQEQFRLDEMTDTTVAGQIEASQAGLLFLPVPYDKGWTAYIDGEKVSIEPYLDSMISLPVDAGTHDVYLVYHVPMLGVGAVMSALGVVGLIVTGLTERAMKRRQDMQQMKMFW